MKNYLTAIGIAALTLTTTLASAVPVTNINGINVSSNAAVIETGPAYIFTNTGNFNIGDVAGVVGKVTSIVDGPTSTTTWLDGQNGQELDFYAKGFVVNYNTTTGTTRELHFQAGSVEFFTNPLGSLKVSSGPATAITSVTGGTSWLTTNATNTGPWTVFSTNQTVGQQLGTATGYLDVVGGPAASVFNTNTFANGTSANSDLLWYLSFGVKPTTPAGFTSDGGITVQGYSTTQISEPASLLLFTTGLGFILLRRKV